MANYRSGGHFGAPSLWPWRSIAAADFGAAVLKCCAMRRVVVRASLFLIAVSALHACVRGADRFQYSGTLQDESAQVGSTIGGRVSAVFVSDGQRVRKNQVLVRLQDSDQSAALAAAMQQAAQAAAALANLEAGPRPAELARAAAGEQQALAGLRKAQSSEADIIAQAADNVGQARAALRQSQAAAVQATQNYRRVAHLRAQGAVAPQAADDALSADRQAQAAVAAAQARVSAAQAALSQTAAAAPQDVAAAQRAYDAALANRQLVQQGARPQEIAQARAALNAAKANVLAAQSRLSEMVVKAPADGIVNQVDLHAGDLLAPRAQVAALHELRDPFVRIYVVQTDLGRVRIGQAVAVRSDALNGAEFSGNIEQVDQNAQFTPRDVQTAQDRADLTFGVKVRVHDPGHRLPGGSTVEVALQ